MGRNPLNRLLDDYGNPHGRQNPNGPQLPDKDGRGRTPISPEAAQVRFPIEFLSTLYAGRIADINRSIDPGLVVLAKLFQSKRGLKPTEGHAPDFYSWSLPGTKNLVVPFPLQERILDTLRRGLFLDLPWTYRTPRWTTFNQQGGDFSGLESLPQVKSLMKASDTSIQLSGWSF